ncbi:RNA polymerase sigma factor [Tunturiibacter lichenicola]|uniref:RNA polymerase sigma factor n=1 Tax=Tunturiibacter lichenicola TaxID=2051959 RepID=UPI0021B21F54|nr:sigma factor [Edaphobacter lichenicola]
MKQTSMISPSKRDGEQAMISAILLGDCALFHDLIRPHERKVYAVAYALLRDEVAAEEVAIGVCLAAFRRLSDLDTVKEFGAWLIGFTIEASCTKLQARASEGGIGKGVAIANEPFHGVTSK